MKKESRAIEQKKQKALKYTIKEGSANSASNAISSAYITPFALKLSQNEFFVGLLSAISGLIAPLAQFYGSHLMKKFNRKSIIYYGVLWQAILWLPMVILAILKYFNIFQNSLIYLLIIFYSLLVAIGGITYPPWFSWMGDLVKEEHKGRFYAKRNTVAGIFELSATVLGGLILRFTESSSFALISFAIIFTASFLLRLISLHYIAKTYIDDKVKVIIPPSYRKTIFKKKSFRTFLFFNLFLYFSVFFASPFFAVYMLKELHFNYIIYMAVSLSGGVYYLIFNKSIGKFSDKFGNTKLLILSGICFALNPLLWMLSKSPIYLIFIPGLVTGIANSALILAVNNFSLDSLSRKERGQGISLVNLFSGIGIFVGSILGGLVLEAKFSMFSFDGFMTLFLIGFLIRALVTIIFVPLIKEARTVKELPHVNVSLMHPFKSIHSEMSWARHVFK